VETLYSKAGIMRVNVSTIGTKSKKTDELVFLGGCLV